MLEPKGPKQGNKKETFQTPHSGGNFAEMYNNPKYFTKQDVSNRYWQIKVNEEKLMAFNF